MSIQASISGFSHGSAGPEVKRYPDPPSDDELDSLIAPDDLYPFPVEEVEGITTLRRRIRDIIFYQDDSLEGWSRLLGDHISYGNKKVASSTAIYNVGSATDCTNLDSPQCQVSAEDCYAKRSENAYKTPLDYRRRQAIVFSLLDGVTWARAFRRHVERKRNPVNALRFNESGDFRSRHEILKLETIGARLNDIVDTYTYSASSDLPWKQDVHSVTVNQSNNFRDYGARQFVVVNDVEEIPDDGGIRCPNDLDESVKCGDCRLCLDEGAGDVYVKNFYADEENGSGGGVKAEGHIDYRAALQEWLPDGWAVENFEREGNTSTETAIFDAVVVHRETNSMVQAVPHKADAEQRGYTANRVRAQNGVNDSEYYVGLTAADIDIPQTTVASEITSAFDTHRDDIVDGADYPSQAAIHNDEVSAAVANRAAYWTAEMALVGMLAAIQSVERGIVTQATLGGF